MAIKNINVGGVNNQDGDLILAEDVNETNDAIIASGLLGMVAMFDISNGSYSVIQLQARGWAVCDGTTPASQGITDANIQTTTPNMSHVFPRGSNDETSGDTGGVETHTHDVDVNISEDTEDGSGGTDAAARAVYTSTSASNVPPYYEFVFFKKVKLGVTY